MASTPDIYDDRGVYMPMRICTRCFRPKYTASEVYPFVCITCRQLQKGE